MLEALTELDHHLGRLRAAPLDEDAAAAALRLGRRERRLHAVVRALEERGACLLEADAGRAVETWLEAALVAEEELGDLQLAAALYERVLETDGRHRRALFALGLVLHDLQRWDDLIALYRRRIQVTVDESERVTLEQYIAELLSEKKEDPHGAFAALVAAARRAPSNLRVIHRLVALGEQLGRLEEVAITIGDMLMQQDTAQLRAALGVRLAELYMGSLNDPARALAHLRGALLDDGGNPEVLEEVADVVREQARFEELARLMEELGGEHALQPYRALFERELARIYELELEDHGRALAALERALESQPEDRTLLDDVLRLGRRMGEEGRVIEVYRRVEQVCTNPLLRALIQQRLSLLEGKERSG